jgi:hypothetical protein
MDDIIQQLKALKRREEGEKEEVLIVLFCLVLG